LRGIAGSIPYLLLILIFFISPWGCFYRVTLEPAISLKIDPREYQPVALLPFPAPRERRMLVPSFIPSSGIPWKKRDTPW